MIFYLTLILLFKVPERNAPEEAENRIVAPWLVVYFLRGLL
jgi:uncharacterized membrane protein YadS